MRHSFRGVIAFGLYHSCCAFVAKGPSPPSAFGKGIIRRPTSEGRVRGEMATTGDARHHPSALRNRDFVSRELLKWVGREQEHGDGASQLLEIASGTGELCT